jgi:hypothetical protein
VNTSAYLDYLKALNFRPNDTVCLSFLREQDKKWDDNNFMSFSTLSEPSTIEKLAQLNSEGWNVYLSMAPFKPNAKHRKKDFVSDVRHAFIDIDSNGPEQLEKVNQDVKAGIVPAYSVVTESSPNKYQITWCVDGLTIEQQESLNRSLQRNYQADPAAIDTARVLRVPGFINWKYEEKPTARLVAGETHILPGDLSEFKIEMTEEVSKPVDANPKGAIIPYGSHDTELTRIAGKLRYDGLEVDALTNALIEICEKRCENYGTDYREMCEKIAHSIGKKPVGQESAVLISGKLAGAFESQKQAGTDEIQPLITVDGDAFIQENIKPRKALIRLIDRKSPIFTEQSINQIFAWRGLGKTCLGFGLTKAFATASSFLNWEATDRCRVLYIEGELPASQAQQRWRQIIGPTAGYAKLVTIDKQPDNMIPSLASQVGMAKVEKTLAALESQGFKTDVLILDSISTLFNIPANEEEGWLGIQSWLIKLRSRGLCIFFFHHAGKSGLSRSHSKSEDMLDISIKLDHPKDPDTDCLHALVHYDKYRSGFAEPDAEIKMYRRHSANCLCGRSKTVVGCSGDSVEWERKLSGEGKRADAERMFQDGMANQDIADELDITPSTIRNWRKKWTDKAGRQSIN